MKKIVISTIAAVVVLGGVNVQAAEVDKEAVQELIDANSAIQRLDRHEDVTIHAVGYGQNDTTADCTWYYSPDVLHVYSDESGEQQWVEAGHWYYSFVSEDESVTGEGMYINEDQYNQELTAYLSATSLQVADTENLISLENEDGQLVLITQSADEETITTGANALGQTEPYEYQEGMTIQFEYYFDAETKDQTKIIGTLLYADGTSCQLTEDTFTYDTGAETQEDWLLALKEPKETRTITIVMDPDTAEEKTTELTVAKEAEVVLIPDTDGVYTEFYQDKACTIAWEKPEEKVDVTVYTKK